MSLITLTTCHCCLKSLMPAETRIPTTFKTREIFEKFIGRNLESGCICSKCNINLLTFDAFQKEIKRKHEAQVKIKTEIVDINADKEELIEGIIFEEDDQEPEQPVIAHPTSPPKQPEQNENKENSDEDDENDVIVVPQEPQVPIDLDAISDEPAEPETKPPEEILYKCDHCTAVSSKKEVIVQHIRQSHTFKCGQCSKVYPKQERLDAHINRVHNAAAGNKRKQSLVPMKTEGNLKFRLKQRPYGRPWPSVLAKRKEEWGY